MRYDKGLITLVVDRSGSMDAIRADAEGGVNSLIAEQAQQPGEALLTLIQFDTEYECVHSGVSLDAIPKYELRPRGCTALLDAVGRGINETSEKLSSLNEADRPGLIIFVIVTDGMENSSHEFTKSQIKDMIERQQREYNWHFTFLGANQDAFAEAGAMGIHAEGTAEYSTGKIDAAYRGTSSKVARMRRQSRTGQIVSNSYTDQESDDMRDLE